MKVNIKELTYRKTDDGFILAEMRNVRALPNEPNLMPIMNLVPWLLLYYDANPTLKSEKYWEGYAKGYKFLFDQLDESDEIKQLAASLTVDKSSAREKVSGILDFCRAKIKNLSYDLHTSKEKLGKAMKQDLRPREIVKKGEAYDFGIDRLFVSLVSAAGLEVRFVFTGDRRNFFFQKQYAYKSLLSYAGLAVRTPAGWYFCNPGAEFVPPGHLYWFSEGQDALLVGKKESEWTVLPISSPEFNKSVQTAHLKLTADGDLEGTVKVALFGFTGADYTQNYHQISIGEIKEKIRNSLKKHFSNAWLEVKNVQNENVSEPPFEFEYEIKISDYARTTGKRMIFQPGVFEFENAPVFTNSNRQTPVYFDLLKRDLQEIEFELPDNYEIENLPAIQPLLSSDFVKFNISTEFNSKSHSVIYKRDYSLGENGRLLYPADSYPAIKSLFDRVRISDQALISLKKNSS